MLPPSYSKDASMMVRKWMVSFKLSFCTLSRVCSRLLPLHSVVTGRDSVHTCKRLPALRRNDFERTSRASIAWKVSHPLLHIHRLRKPFAKVPGAEPSEESEPGTNHEGSLRTLTSIGCRNFILFLTGQVDEHGIRGRWTEALPGSSTRSQRSKTDR